MATIVSSLLVRLGVDPSGVKSGMGEATGIISSHRDKIAAAGTAIGAAGGLAVGVGFASSLNMEAANDKLAAQLDLSAAESARIGKVAGGLYADAYGGSIEEVNAAIQSVITNVDGMRTASEDDLTAISAKILDVATGMDQDLGEVAKAVGQLMRTGLARNADEAMDLIATGFSKSANRGGDFLDTLSTSAVNLKQFGFTGKTALGFLIQGMEHGAPSADALTGALEELIGNAGDSAEIFKSLGFNGKQMARDLSGGGPAAAEALDKLLDKLRNMQDPAKKATTLVSLFGEEATAMGPALTAIDLSKASQEIGNVGGAAERFGQTLNENAQTTITGYQRKIEGMLASLVDAPGIIGQASGAVAGFGGAVLPVAGQLGVVAIAAKGMSGGIVSSVGKAALWLGKLGVAALVGTGKAILALVRLAGQAALATARVVAQIVIQVARWAWMGAQSLLHAAKVAAAWLIAMGPIGLVIAAVVALVVLIVKNWDTIKKVIAAAWAWIKDRTAAAWNWIKDKVSGLVRGILGAVGWLGQLPGRVAGWFGRVRDAAVSRLQGLVSWLRGLPGRILRAVGNLGNLLYGAGRAVVTGLWDGIKSLAGWVAGQVSSWVRSILPGPVERLLGISSPSKVARGWGVAVGEGLVLGLGDSGRMVARASGDLARQISVPDTMPGGPGLAQARTSTGLRPGLAGGLHIEHYHEAPVGDARRTAEELMMLAGARG